MSTEVTRQNIFREAAKTLRREFDELGAALQHHGLRGGEAEKIVRKFLREHLPRRFDVGAGLILDGRDQLSPQTDVIVYDSINCPVYRTSDVAGVFPSDNVAAVIEVKSTLDKRELLDAFEKGAAVKALAKTGPGGPLGPLHRQTTTCVFAFTSSVDLDTIGKHYASDCRARLVHHTDMVIVLDQGIATLAARYGSPGWSTAFIEDMPDIDGAHLATGVWRHGQDTLDVFLRLLIAQLTLFWSRVHQPGFDWRWTESGGQAQLTYLTTTCTEKDPVRRAARLQAYEKEVHAEFERGRTKPGSDPSV